MKEGSSILIENGNAVFVPICLLMEEEIHFRVYA
jgi:hypothetical protein